MSCLRGDYFDHLLFALLESEESLSKVMGTNHTQCGADENHYRSYVPLARRPTLAKTELKVGRRPTLEQLERSRGIILLTCW